MTQTAPHTPDLQAEIARLHQRISALEEANAALQAQHAEELRRRAAEQQQQEERLIQSRMMFQSLIDNTPSLVFARDLEGHFLLINRCYCETVLGRPPETVLGKTPHELFALETADQFRQNDQRIITTGETIAREEQIPHRDGQMRTYLAVKFPLYDTQGTLYAVGGISTDITDIKQSEAERAALQQQIIETQQATLREVSTPLIPLTNSAVMLPLIGTVDPQRSQQMLETLLEGVATRQARLAILDITGIKVIDTQVADTLIRAAQAVNLIGARMVLTGMQPAVAQTLVDLGIDLGHIVTHTTLQAGIAYALST